MVAQPQGPAYLSECYWDPMQALQMLASGVVGVIGPAINDQEERTCDKGR
jgi:hypothetical protein